jgi:hypothetical protein
MRTNSSPKQSRSLYCVSEVAMMNRATRVFWAVLTGIVASTSIAVIPLRAESASGKCYLYKPETAAPTGQHWSESVEPVTNRRCWTLRKVDPPSQPKAAAPLPVARTAVHAPAATPPRPTQAVATNAMAAPVALPAQPVAQGDGNGAAAATAAIPPASEPAEQSPPTVQPPAAELQLPAPRVLDPGLALLSRALVTPAPASQPQETKQDTIPQANIDAARAPVPAAAEAAGDPYAVGAPVQILLLAIFCGPALYLFAAGAFRRVVQIEPPPPPYPSLDGVPASRLLLPPRLEPNETIVQS